MRTQAEGIRTSVSSIAVAIVGLIWMSGCAATDPEHDAGSGRSVVKPTDNAIEGAGVVKPIRWGVMSLMGERVRIGALVPYCEDGRQRPQIERIEHRRRESRLVLTMFVRFFNRSTSGSGGCMFLQVGVSRWVRVGAPAGEFDLYDGSTSPPSRRRVYQR